MLEFLRQTRRSHYRAAQHLLQSGVGITTWDNYYKVG